MKAYTLLTLIFTTALLSGCSTKDGNIGAEKYMSEREQKAALAKVKTPQYYGFQVFPIEGGISFRGQARLHPNHQAEMDFLDGQPVIKIRGKSKRQKGQALLDFSSANTWIEFDKSQEFDVTFLGMNEEFFPSPGQSGGVNGYAGVIRQIRIENLFMENVPLFVRMSRGALGPVARNIYDPHVDVSLGYDVLSQFETIQISMRHEKVIFSSSHPYIPNEDLLMSSASIQRISGYGLVIAGTIYGQKTPIVLDLAGDYHFMRNDKRVANTKQVGLGDLVYRKVPTQFLNIEGALPRAGRKMLEPYLITICPQQGFVYFERYPED